MTFESARNYLEVLVFKKVREVARHHPQVAGDEGLLVDVACIALNSLPPRYMRHQVDLAFHISDSENRELSEKVNAAVDAAFKFVEAARRADSH